MKDSQNAAIYNAYKRANRTVSFENKGVLVAGVAKGMPSEGKLKLEISSLPSMEKHLKRRNNLLNI